MSESGPTLHDAYRKWLKIDGQFPPDHYALLGLPRFEADAAKIELATIERMKIVRPRCLKYHELGTQLLNQIAKANVCLSNAEQRAAYDQSLQTGSVTAAVSARKAVGEDRARLQQLLDEALKELKASRAAKDASAGRPPPKLPDKPATPPARRPQQPEDDFELTLSSSDTDNDAFELTLDDDFDLTAGDSGISLSPREDSDFELSLDDGSEFDLSLDDDVFDLSLDDDFDDDDFDIDVEDEDPIERNVRRLLAEERSFQQRGRSAGRSQVSLSDADDDWNDVSADDDDLDNPFAVAPPRQPLTENQKALLLVSVLTVSAVVIIGGLIAFNLRGGSKPDEPAIPTQRIATEEGSATGTTTANGATTDEGNPLAQPGANSGPDFYAQADDSIPAGNDPYTDPYAAAAGDGFSRNPPGSEQKFPSLAPGAQRPEKVEMPGVPLERFQGTLVRIEQRGRQVVLSVQVSSSTEIGDDPDFPPPPPPPNDPTRNPAARQPLAFNTLVVAIVADPAFAKNVFDYQSLEEGVDEILATGRPGDFLGADGSAAFSGDSIELVGWRSSEGASSLSLPPGAVTIKLKSIQKVGQSETFALATEPRLGALDTTVHDRRTPLRKLLRGWNTGFENRAVVAGNVVEASDISHLRFQPDLTALPMIVNAATLNFAGQSLLTETNVPVKLTVMFNGTFDDLGQPVLQALSASRGDAVAAAADSEFSPMGETGGEVLPMTRGGFDADAPYRPPAAEYVDERWYVIQIPDSFTKTVDYVVVYGEQAKKDTIADYRASGTKAYAATGSHKSEEDAYAYIERVQARRMPRNAYP